MLVDTHAHLNFPDFKDDLVQVIERSVKNGVKKIICVSSNIEDSQKAIEIAQKYPGIVHPAVGIHPQQTDPKNSTPLKEQIKQLTELTGHKKVVAIGECGLDYSPAPPGEKDRTRDEQFFLFKAQIKIAQKLALPLIIHTRKAFADTVQFLESGIRNHELGIRGVFHCYSAGKKGIEKINQLGFYFGVDGNLTYDQGLQNVFRLISLEKILLETDTPLLSPEPFRGQRNEPKNTKIIAKSLAKIKNKPFKKVAQQTTQNAIGLFCLKK